MHATSTSSASHVAVQLVGRAWLDEIVSAKDRRRLPVVLTPREVRTVLNQLDDTTGLATALLRGTGMWLQAALRLHVKDVCFGRRAIAPGCLQLGQRLPGSTSLHGPVGHRSTVHDDAVTDKIAMLVGKRVTLHYEEKVGLPGSCFGETRHFVNDIVVSEGVPLAAGVMVPTHPASAAASAASR